MTLVSFHSVFLWQQKLHDQSQVSVYCCRCRIPDCDSTEATFNPDWLQNAVPFHQHDSRPVPRRCLRFAPRNLSLLSDNSEQNVTSCSPESFDNHSVIRCNEWVYAGEETTVLREVRYKCTHTCVCMLRPGPLNPRPRCYATRGDTWNPNKPFETFSGKAEIKSGGNFVNLSAVYVWKHTVHC